MKITSLALLVFLAGCGTATYSQRIRLYPEKPATCSIVRLQGINNAPGYEMIGSVSLVLRNYQVMVGKEVSLDDKTMRKLSAEACKLGGDAVAFGHSDPTGADFVVFHKTNDSAAPATPTTPLNSTSL
jgi:hypothetical protein